MNAKAAALRAHLRQGGLIAYPTESCYGLGCDPRNSRALKHLIRLKGCSAAKGMLLIADHLKRLKPFIRPLNPVDLARVNRSWPGPVTWLLPAALTTPAWLRGSHNSIAVRVSAHPLAARLCQALGMVLVSTSANRSGLKPARTYAACIKDFGNTVLVLPGLVGKRRRPSTIMDLASGGVMRR